MRAPARGRRWWRVAIREKGEGEWEGCHDLWSTRSARFLVVQKNEGCWRRSGVKVTNVNNVRKNVTAGAGRARMAWDGRRSAPDWKGDAITGQAALRQRLRRQVKYR